MARVVVRFFAWLREEIGVSEIVLDGLGSLADLLSGIRKSLGSRSGAIFEDDGSLRNNVIIAINNRIVSSEGSFEKISLRDGDIIDIMPLGSGG